MQSRPKPGYPSRSSMSQAPIIPQNRGSLLQAGSLHLLAALTLATSTTAAAAARPIAYATEQVISADDTPAEIVEKAAKVLPRANQSAWMRHERTFFLH